MKAFLVSTLALLGSLQLQAQTSSSTPAPAPATTPATTPAPAKADPTVNRILSAVTPAERNQLLAARTKAMANNPSLQASEASLMRKAMTLSSGTPEDGIAFRTEMLAHVQKMRVAMLQADPSLEPILVKIEAEGAKMQAEQQGVK